MRIGWVKTAKKEQGFRPINRYISETVEDRHIKLNVILRNKQSNVRIRQTTVVYNTKYNNFKKMEMCLLDI